MWNRKDLIGLHNLYNRICTINNHSQANTRKERGDFCHLKNDKVGFFVIPQKYCEDLSGTRIGLHHKL